MKDTDKSIDPLPKTFATEEEAGEFWDEHSTMDYEGYLEPATDVINIGQRIFEVPVEEDLFQRLQQEARALHESVPKVVDNSVARASQGHNKSSVECPWRLSMETFPADSGNAMTLGERHRDPDGA